MCWQANTVMFMLQLDKGNWSILPRNLEKKQSPCMVFTSFTFSPTMFKNIFIARSPEELEALAASSPLPSLPPAPPLQRTEPSCNLSPEAKENVKGHQDSNCRAQTHYQLGLRMGKKKKENPLHDVLPANYELHPGLKQLTLSTIKILNPVWMRT